MERLYIPQSVDLQGPHTGICLQCVDVLQVFVMTDEFKAAGVDGLTRPQRLRKIRLCFGQTQEMFGLRLGLKKTTYNNYETGARDISPEIAQDICFKIPSLKPEYILYGDASRLTGTLANKLGYGPPVDDPDPPPPPIPFRPRRGAQK